MSGVTPHSLHVCSSVYEDITLDWSIICSPCPEDNRNSANKLTHAGTLIEDLCTRSLRIVPASRTLTFYSIASDTPYVEHVTTLHVSSCLDFGALRSRYVQVCTRSYQESQTKHLVPQPRLTRTDRPYLWKHTSRVKCLGVYVLDVSKHKRYTCSKKVQ